MSDGARTGRPRRLAHADEPPADEDFLYHLSRGGELLVQNRVVEAKEELEKALEVRPQDAQGQDLLAGVYFRLGVYPTAIKLWRRLVEQFPNDAVLNVNLGLALFKTGQPEQAREHLERALSIEPDHERAWGYLGLTLWRLGALEEAREAFLRGGQLSMARRMEEQASASSPSPSTLPPETDAELSAMRDAAGEGAERLGRGEMALSVEEERSGASGGAWRVVETGADSVPGELALRSAAAAASPPALADWVDRYRLRVASNEPFGLGPAGELWIETAGAVHARLADLRAVRGPLRAHPVERRYRGRANVEEPLGGSADPIVRWQGPVAAVLGAPAGLGFHILRVGGTHLYVREDHVAAFDDRLGYESGDLPLVATPATLVSFHGEGAVVLRLARAPVAMELRSEDELHVDPRALVGWIGRVFPAEAPLARPAHASLALRGQGAVLLA
jgi:Flp pilus assembly protein TadD